MNDRGSININMLAAAVYGSAGVASGVVWVGVFFQEAMVVGGDNVPATVLGALAVAISALTGAVGWLVRRFLSGDWVRVDQAKLVTMMAETVAALDRAGQREERMTQWLFDEHVRDPRDDHRG